MCITNRTKIWTRYLMASANEVAGGTLPRNCVPNTAGVSNTSEGISNTPWTCWTRLQVCPTHRALGVYRTSEFPETSEKVSLYVPLGAQCGWVCGWRDRESNGLRAYFTKLPNDLFRIRRGAVCERGREREGERERERERERKIVRERERARENESERESVCV